MAQSRDFLENMLRLSLGEGTPYTSGATYLLLYNGSVTDTTTMTTLAGLELAASNGYARQLLTPGVIAYDPTDVRAEAPEETITFTASGGSIGPFNGVAVIVSGTGTAGATTGTVRSFYTTTEVSGVSSVTLTDGQSYQVNTNFVSLTGTYA